MTMDAKGVALQLRKLASDPDTQTHLVKQKGCLKGLMTFMDHSDKEVQLIALQALQFLSANPVHRELLAKEEGLLAKLLVLKESENDKMKAGATTVMGQLEAYINGTATTAGKPKPKPDHATPAFKPRYLYNIPLRIEDLGTQSQVGKAEQVLLGVAGVVSITMEKTETEARVALVYTRANQSEITPVLLAALKDNGFKADVNNSSQEKAQPSYQRRNTTDENSAVHANLPAPSSTPSSSSSDKPQAPRPIGYLNKSTLAATGALNPLGGLGVLAAARRGSASLALAPYAGVQTSIQQNSVESRLKQQKQKEQEQQQKEGTLKNIFGSVTSYFW